MIHKEFFDFLRAIDSISCSDMKRIVPLAIDRNVSLDKNGHIQIGQAKKRLPLCTQNTKYKVRKQLIEDIIELRNDKKMKQKKEREKKMDAFRLVSREPPQGASKSI